MTIERHTRRIIEIGDKVIRKWWDKDGKPNVSAITITEKTTDHGYPVLKGEDKYGNRFVTKSYEMIAWKTN